MSRANDANAVSRAQEGLRAESFVRTETKLGGWPVGITTYRIGETWFCKIDNVSPGAIVARSRAETREAAIASASERVTPRLAATRIIPLR